MILKNKPTLLLLAWRFTEGAKLSKPLFKEIGALNIYKLNIFNIFCLVIKCKSNNKTKIYISSIEKLSTASALFQK